jgi:hypothetical protein
MMPKRFHTRANFGQQDHALPAPALPRPARRRQRAGRGRRTLARVAWQRASEPENQSNLEMNALWNHFVFPAIGTAKRAFIFKLSAAARLPTLPRQEAAYAAA